ncbi:TetR family transcriptional regulator [Enterocloster aldenensis]|nr:TetR family transcriptional regulator [Enterocloster aldenensis]
MMIPDNNFIFMGQKTTYAEGNFMAIDVKKLFANAIIELSNEKSLSKVTVTDIVKHVGTGRQTFYNHFLDKNDLIFWIFLRTLRGEKKIIESSGFYTYLLSIYEKAILNQPFFTQACHLEGQNCLLEAIYNQTYNYYKDYISNRFGEHVLTDECLYALAFNAHGASNMYVKWACDGMVVPPRDMAKYAMNSTPECLKVYLTCGNKDREQQVRLNN